MYNPLQNIVSNKIPSVVDASTTWEQDFLAASEIMAEMTADSVLGYVNESVSEFQEDIIQELGHSLNNGGIDQTSANIVNAAVKLMAKLGQPVKYVPVLAGESFGSNDDRLANTVLIGEAFDVKQKMKDIWEWIKEKFRKVRAWLLKKFDGITKLSKAFRKLAEAAKKAQTDGKVAKKGKKLKVSKADLKTLSLDAPLSGVTKDNISNVLEITGGLSADSKTITAAVDEGVNGLNELVDSIDDSDQSNAIGIAKNIIEGDKDNEDDRVPVGGLRTLNIKKSDVSIPDDANLATALKSVKKYYSEITPKIETIEEHKNVKFSDKEVAPLSLSDVVSICDDITTHLDKMADLKDKLNRDLDVEKSFGGVKKSINNLSDDNEKYVSVCMDILQGTSSTITMLSVTLPSELAKLAQSTYSVCKGSLALYGKEA